MWISCRISLGSKLFLIGFGARKERGTGIYSRHFSCGPLTLVPRSRTKTPATRAGVATRSRDFIGSLLPPLDHVMFQFLKCCRCDCYFFPKCYQIYSCYAFFNILLLRVELACVAGAWKKKKERAARRRHARGEGSFFPCVAPSCAQSFGAHYFQAPATQTKVEPALLSHLALTAANFVIVCFRCSSVRLYSSSTQQANIILFKNIK